MPTLVRRKPWGAIQPAPGARVNSTHSLAQGLARAYLLGSAGVPRDSVLGSTGSDTGTGPVATIGGSRLYAGASTSFSQIASKPILGGLAAWSVVAGVSYYADTGDAGTIYAERAASGNDLLRMEITSTASSPPKAVGTVYRNDAGTLVNAVGSSSLPMNQLVQVAMTFDNSHVVGYYNGVAQVSTSWAGANNNFTDSGIEATIGVDIADASSGLSGNVSYLYLYKRALTPADLVHISTTPYAMFVAPTQFDWMANQPTTTEFAAMVV